MPHRLLVALLLLFAPGPQQGVAFLVVRGLSDRAGRDARTEARGNLEAAARNAARAALAVGRRLASEGP